jgi:NTE family protein
MSRRPTIALVLTGGGARAAYQVGVLRAIAQLMPHKATSPFAIVCGTSAGAFNAAAIAAGADDFRRSVLLLTSVWKNFHAGQVYRADVAGIAANGARWLAALMLGGLGRHNPASLFDNAPLARFIESRLDLTGIARAIDNGTLQALAITASGYTSGQSITFYQGRRAPDGWQRARRVGTPAVVGIPHLMASAAMPFIFPAVRIDNDYYGDGSMRQIAPLSPALHLGADRLLIISVGRRGTPWPDRTAADGYPSLARIGGHALTSIFFDALEADVEQLERINAAVAQAPVPLHDAKGNALRRVDYLLLTPSQGLDELAAQYLDALPRPVRFFLRGVGAMRRSGSTLASYLLFEKAFTRALIRLGCADTMARRSELLALLAGTGASVDGVPG